MIICQLPFESEKGRVVGFEASLSGDLKKLVGESNYSYVVPEIKPETTRGSVVKSGAHTQTVLEQDEIQIVEMTKNEIKAAIAAIEAWDTYKEKYNSVRLSGFLVDKLAKSLPGLDHLQRKGVFERLEELEILWTTVSSSWYGDESFTVFKIREENPYVIKLRKTSNL